MVVERLAMDRDIILVGFDLVGGVCRCFFCITQGTYLDRFVLRNLRIMMVVGEVRSGYLAG